MISYEEAMNIVRDCGARRPLGHEEIPLPDIAGRICAAAIAAPISNQPFDNAAMDGFALKAEDLAMAANDNPVCLDAIGRIVAGKTGVLSAPSKGQCYEIMTGAPMPPGCDAVVPVEKTEVQQGQIFFHAAVSPHENVRFAGEDFSAGAGVLAKGDRLSFSHILPLATLGIEKVAVLRRPKVAVFSTGLEVVDDLSRPLAPGEIYNSTGPYLRAALPAFGASVFESGTVADDPADFKKKVAAAIDGGADMIVSTGAVSAGVHDFIKGALEEMGAEILFHKVRIRPGKPMLLAKFPQGGPFFVGLPGNPVASAAGLRFFIAPLIRAMQGLPPEKPVRAILANDYKKGTADFRMFLRAVCGPADDGTIRANILKKQQSFMVSSFIDANGWAVAPEAAAEMKAGDLVDFYPAVP